LSDFFDIIALHSTDGEYFNFFLQCKKSVKKHRFFFNF